MPPQRALCIMGTVGEGGVAIDHRRYTHLVLATVLLAGLAACRGGRAAQAPARPTSTPIPVATPLPPLPTLPRPGSEDNPLQWVLVQPAPQDEASAAALAERLTDEAALNIEIVLGDRYADAYRALCGGTAAVVSLDAFSYLVVAAQGCGELLFQTEQDGHISTQGQIVAAADRIFSPPNIRDRIFCRPDALSVSGWIVPMLALQAEGIDPFTDLQDVVDAGSDEEVLRLIAEGRCDVGATALGAQALLDDPQAVDVIAELPPVPSDVLVLSSRLDADTRAVLIDLLRQHRDEVAALLGADALREADIAAFGALRALLDEAGVAVIALAH